jgi:hypothetical protein
MLLAADADPWLEEDGDEEGRRGWEENGTSGRKKEGPESGGGEAMGPLDQVRAAADIARALLCHGWAKIAHNFGEEDEEEEEEDEDEEEEEL